MQHFRGVYALAITCSIAPIILPAFAQRASPAPSRQSSALVGTWHLVSRIVTLPDGTVMRDVGLGASPLGTLTYTADGNVAAQLMSRNRPDTVDCTTTSSVSMENNDRSINHYDAYFGTYTVDESRHIVTHHLLGALAAEDVGKNLVRQFVVAGDTLTIVTSTESSQGKQLKKLKWVRGR
ncbi:MAG TPA: lipocalin-like domain-containing protein [Gemmatimonadaceae bacterium]